MKTFASIVIAVSMLCLASCSNKSAEQAAAKDVKADEVKMGAARPGGYAAETASMTATVQSINAADRTVTLKDSDGSIDTYQCSKEIVNFDQIKVGDHVKATSTEELVMFIRKAGDPPSVAASAVITRAPKGAKPGGTITTTGEVTAKVQVVDAANHKLILIGPKGNVRAFQVDPQVNLDGVRIGDNVVAQFSRSLTITVETPRWLCKGRRHMNVEHANAPSLKQKAVHEVKELVTIFLYLALFFCTFATYRRLLLREMGVGYFHYGFALFKALILAKVILLGQHVRLVRIFNDRPLIVPTIYKVIIFSIFTVIFDVIEHVVGSLIHGHGVMYAFGEIFGVGKVELLARALVILFAFLPFFAFSETGRILGEGQLHDLFLGRKP